MQEIRRKTRRRFSAEEKIRIVLEGLRGEESIAALCRREGLAPKLCGVCPIPASSGRTTGRHRLNRGGHRQANAALYRAVIVRRRFHQPTRDDVARRTATGWTKREIIRCLKRFLAREIYQRVMTDFRTP